MCHALNQLFRIKDLSAFSVVTAKRRKLNQHSTFYTFADDSTLKINATRSEGIAFNGSGQWVASFFLKINRQGD